MSFHTKLVLQIGTKRFKVISITNKNAPVGLDSHLLAIP